jgi:peptidoglycan/LPS O-acetylase OafA/YrhL
LITVLIAVSLALATLSFRFIEVTGRRWLRQRLDVGRPPAVVGVTFSK